MGRFDQRQGFLMSAIVHLMIMMALITRVEGKKAKAVSDSELPVKERIFLPPASVLRQLAPPPARPTTPAPRPTPPPAEAKAKDRISVGAPSLDRAKVLELRREDDLTKVPKGKPNAVPSPPPPPEPAVAQATPAPNPGSAEEIRAAQGLRLPPGVGPAPGQDGARAGGSTNRPSLAESLRNLDRRLADGGARGIESGTGQQMGPLFFDPEGADFTVWVNHFKNEVYRNWIVPQAAIMGFGGHVDIEFTVERDGTMSNMRMIKSSGTPALDRAAQNALLGSRLLPLPADYGPPRVTMNVTFYYNTGPQG